LQDAANAVGIEVVVEGTVVRGRDVGKVPEFLQSGPRRDRARGYGGKPALDGRVDRRERPAAGGGVGPGRHLGEARTLGPCRASVEDDPVEDALDPTAVAPAPQHPVPTGLGRFVGMGGHDVFLPDWRMGPPSGWVEGRCRHADAVEIPGLRVVSCADRRSAVDGVLDPACCSFR
jgi:hypothetical protein